jgi:ParB-like chromosome segregation protein Spo0J
VTSKKNQAASPIPAALWMPIDSLVPWAKNPRLNDGTPVEKVAKSLKTFGFVAPICVWTSAGRMVAGHTRLKAMRSLLAADPTFIPKGAPGPGLVPVRFHEFTDEAEADAYAIADNRLGEEAEWHKEALAEIVEGLSATRAELLDAAGLERAEVTDLIGAVRELADGDAFGALPSGDREPFQQMTFTLHDAQVDVVREAIRRASAGGPFTAINSNGNGNALARIAEAYLGKP